MNFILFGSSIRRKQFRMHMIFTGEMVDVGERGKGKIRVCRICYPYHGNCQVQTMIYAFASFTNFIFAFKSTIHTVNMYSKTVRFGIHFIRFISLPFFLLFFEFNKGAYIRLAHRKRQKKTIVVVS